MTDTAGRVFLVITALLAARGALRADEEFEREVRPLLKAHCYECHGAKVQKAKLDLERGLGPSHVARDLKIWQESVRRVSAGVMPPKGKPALSEPERAAFARWLEGRIAQLEAAEPSDPGPSFPRRITRREYRNAVRDLVRFSPDVESYLPEARSMSGYDNQIGQLVFPPDLLERYLMMADSILDGADWNLGNARDKEPINRWYKVREGLNKRTARQAAEENLRLLARMAFRRPPDDAELEVLLKAFDRSREKKKDFHANQKYALKTLLVMPQFLYRVETLPAGDRPVPIDDYELAARLAAFLWSSIPDPELLDAAAAGTLHEPKLLLGQVRRMMKDARISRLASEFPEQWLFGRQQTHAIDTVRFPAYTPGLAKASSDELALCFEKIIKEERSVIELLDCNYTFVNEELAPIYGIQGIRDTQQLKMREVTVPDARRGGLLGMAIMHQKTSMPSRTSPTNRGKWVLDALLGTPPPPPPADVNNSVDASAQDPDGRPLSLREKLEKHGQQGTSCANCHLRMDPIGFALENFDPIGQYREKDGSHPVLNSGKLPDGMELRGVESLKKVLLARKDQFVHTLTSHLLTYALGRDLESYDLPTVRRVTDAVLEKDFRMDVLIEEIIQSYPFLHKRSPRADEKAPGAEEKKP
jgi:hypothetical protein